MTADPILNLQAEHPPIYVAKPWITWDDRTAVQDALLKSEIALGESVTQFETMFAQKHQVKYASSCNSGTSALILALAGLNIWENDVVLIPAFSMVALSNSVLIRRATPVFIDSDSNNLVGNTSLEQIKRTLVDSHNLPKPKCILLQHTYGEPIDDIEEIANFCRDNNMYLIEDCAEAMNAKINGRSVGTFGDVAIFSFYANKVITSGEGGMVISNNQELIERVNRLKAHCFSHEKHFCHTESAYGLRLPNISCALGLSQLKRLDEILKIRHDLRVLYNIAFSGKAKFKIPDSTVESSWWVMPIVLDTEVQRDHVRKVLAERGVETRTYFVGMNNQSFLKSYVLTGQQFPVSDRLAECGLYLPLYPGLKTNDIEYITRIVLDAV